MQSQEKSKIIEAISSGKRSKIYEAIEKMKEDGGAELLPLVFDLYQEYKDDDLREKIFCLLRDIKDKEAPGVFVKELRSRTWGDEVSVILSSCWQSGLDYSPYIESFLPFAASSDIKIQMEALTNIEQFFFNKNAVNREKVISELKNTALEAEGKRKDLIMAYLSGLKE